MQRARIGTQLERHRAAGPDGVDTSPNIEKQATSAGIENGRGHPRTGPAVYLGVAAWMGGTSACEIQLIRPSVDST